ncbi:MAG: hypothetical protein OSA11_10775, partial [Candidatus Nanopelagicales bacterium]|nr:hypothetical protein [Candidatus Nanopelagicales bacterium]
MSLLSSGVSGSDVGSTGASLDGSSVVPGSINAVPHFEQNPASSADSVPHFEQKIDATVISPELVHRKLILSPCYVATAGSWFRGWPGYLPRAMPRIFPGASGPAS